jgi:hypothetical protein
VSTRWTKVIVDLKLAPHAAAARGLMARGSFYVNGQQLTSASAPPWDGSLATVELGFRAWVITSERDAVEVEPVQIFHLAVLRASCEQKSAGAYFGSCGALQYWCDGAVHLELVRHKEKGTGPFLVVPTAMGTQLYTALALGQQPPETSRAYLWPGVKELEHKATAWRYGNYPFRKKRG